MSQEQTLSQLYEEFRPNTGVLHQRNAGLLLQWLASRIASARVQNEKFFCTEIKEEGLTAVGWVRENSAFAIVYEFRKDKLALQQTFDFGKSRLCDFGTKTEKKRVKLVSGFVNKLLQSEDLTAQKFTFAFRLFQLSIEGFLIHQKDYEKLLFWCRQILKRKDVMEKVTEKRLNAREGEILEVLGRYDEAVASYQKGISNCDTPDEFAYLYNCIGVALRLAGRIDSAIKMYKKSLDAQENIAAHSNLELAIQIKLGLLCPPRIDGFDHKTQADPDYICQNCHKSGADKICSRCKTARYCNVE